MSQQLVVLKLAFFNQSLVYDMLEIDADKLLCEFFQNVILEEILERFQFITYTRCILVDLVKNAASDQFAW